MIHQRHTKAEKPASVAASQTMGFLVSSQASTEQAKLLVEMYVTPSADMAD